jgi:chromosome segregation ATPase
MSDTPRTKAATRMAFTSEYMVEIEEAQKLERELAEAQKQRDSLADALEKAKIAEMQLENADINLEQCRLNFVGRIKKLEQELKEALTAIAQSKEANAGLMRACDNLERQLADKRSQINRLISVIKSRNTDKVYLDKKYNELRDEVMATREQRDALAEALTEIEQYKPISENRFAIKSEFYWLAHKALAAVKGGSHE